jgi:hypothetical protein
MREHSVQLIGGPLDGWPLIIRGTLPCELRLPYSREMLELASESSDHGKASLRERWLNLTFPSEADADGIAVYVAVTGAEPARYQYVGQIER